MQREANKVSISNRKLKTEQDARNAEFDPKIKNVQEILKAQGKFTNPVYIMDLKLLDIQDDKLRSLALLHFAGNLS